MTQGMRISSTGERPTAARTRITAGNEEGFTLIELLVVILIIGILAAIAIPSFLNQTSKGYDASAKELARTAETTALTIGTDNGGTYNTVSQQMLQTYELTISTSSSGNNNAYVISAGPLFGGQGFYVTAAAYNTNDQFEIIRAANGTITRWCNDGPPLPLLNGVAATGTALTTTAGGCVNGSW
jgi:type IV pilus assembly protein PilA